MKFIKNISISIALSLSFMTIAKEPVLAATPAPPPIKVELSWQATEVAEGLYMLKGVGGFTGGNLGLSIGEDGVILIDDAMPSSLDIMNEALADITPNDIDFLINTHVHGDHTGNNETLGNKGVHIVAHENLRKHLLKKGVTNAQGKQVDAPKSSLPVITFSKSMDFHLNGTNAHIFHVPHAHTDGDAVIHFTHVNVIHMGDVLFNKMFPYIDFNSGGSLDGYIEAQKTVLGLVDDKTKIIPGHGPLANKQDLIDSITMLEDARSIIGKLIKQGKTEKEIVNLNPLAAKYPNPDIEKSKLSKSLGV
ncbi:MAG: MBL fold metallo-hydrolase [Proteobacteria bacterium]|nr:MBL fold metallo-hydrolase [Pseudomonadota bacterium]